MDFIAAPLNKAQEVLIDLVECALILPSKSFPISWYALLIANTIHLDNVWVETGLWGFTYEMKREDNSSSSVLKSCVLSK